MKHKLTKIICFILISSCLLACASCKKCKKDTETTPGDPLLLEIPTISTPDATFLKINDFNVTANQAYHQLLNSYGVDMMMNIIDDDLLPNDYSEEGFEEYLNKIIYQDEEPSEELLNKFLDELTLYCLSKNENDVNYYKSFYRIRYKRYVYAKNCYINNLSSDYFSKARKESEFNNKYPKENDLIIIKFTSATEAKSFMTKYDINTTREKWQSIDGSKIYTNEEVLAKFELMYSDYYNTETGTSNVKTYKLSDLKKISSALASDIYDFSASSYTGTPKTYDGGTYIVYKVSETGNLDEKGNTVTFEEKEQEIINDLIETEVSSAYASLSIINFEINSGLKIFDPGIQNTYKLQYDYVNSMLGKGTDDYTAFVKNTVTNKDNVFSYVKNGETIYVSADKMYQLLTSFYGEYLSALYMKQYLVLKDNGVIDLITLKILDIDKYNKYYASDIQKYKTEFENNSYESLSYPSSYGWLNFVRDYLGLLSEESILLNPDNSLYNTELGKYKENLYLVDGKDNAIQTEMEKVFNDYIYLNGVSVSAYYDLDLDGTADEISKDDEKANLLKQLVLKVYEEVEKRFEKGTSVANALKTIKQEYNQASKYSESIWSSYKAKNIILKIGSAYNYTYNQDATDEMINHLRKQYREIIGYRTTHHQDLTGQDLSKGYTFKVNNVTTSVNSLTFIDTDEDIFFDENSYNTIYTLKATKPYYLDEGGTSYKPTLELYHQYLEDASKLSNAEKNCVYYYYITAVNNIVDSNKINEYLMNDCLKLIDDGNVNYSNLEKLKAYIIACNSDQK